MKKFLLIVFILFIGLASLENIGAISEEQAELD